MQLSRESSKKPQDRTIIVDMGSRDPACLHVCRLWLQNTCKKVRIKVPLQWKKCRKSEDHRSGSSKRICYSLAGLPYLENWGNLKGIVLNLHHSSPPQSAATLCSFLKYALHNSLSALVCLAALHIRMEQQSIGFSGTPHTPIF